MSATVYEYWSGRFYKKVWFETEDEAHQYISKQGDEPGVEWIVIPDED